MNESLTYSVLYDNFKYNFSDILELNNKNLKMNWNFLNKCLNKRNITINETKQKFMCELSNEMMFRGIKPIFKIQ